MTADSLRRPLFPVLLVAAVLSALLVILPARSASAHDELVSSDPAADSTVETLPEELTLTFSAALIASDGGTAVVVTDAEGNDVADGAPVIDGAVLIQKLKTDAALAGDYQVIWQVVSSDGHPTDGEFAFAVTSAAEPTPTTTPTTAPTSEETVAPTPTAVETPAAEDPDIQSGFSLSWPWIIVIVVALLIVAFLVGMSVARRRRSPSSPDSEKPAED